MTECLVSKARFLRLKSLSKGEKDGESMAPTKKRGRKSTGSHRINEGASTSSGRKSTGSHRINEGASTSSGGNSTGSHGINEGASTSSGISSPYAALAFENAQFSQKCPEIWIECVKCHKWRSSRQYFEEREIPDDWQCKMWIRKGGRKGSCTIPGSTDDSQIKHEPFPEGEIVWAKLGKFEFWPGMIESDPVEMISTRETDAGRKQYNVTFFGLKPSRQWAFASNIKKYEKTDPAAFRGKSLRMAIAQGNEAFDTPFTIRIQKYSLATLRTKKSVKSIILDGHPENDCCDDSEAKDEKGILTDGQTEDIDDKRKEPTSSSSRVEDEHDHGESCQSKEPLPSSDVKIREADVSKKILAYNDLLDQLPHSPFSITIRALLAALKVQESVEHMESGDDSVSNVKKDPPKSSGYEKFLENEHPPINCNLPSMQQSSNDEESGKDPENREDHKSELCSPKEILKYEKMLEKLDPPLNCKFVLMQEFSDNQESKEYREDDVDTDRQESVDVSD